jgi:outer membrane protein assembly factor BamA
VIRRDTRDDAIGPHHGSLTSLSVAYCPSVLGTTYRFAVYELDHRSYVTLGSRSVLAMEAYGLYEPGNVPIAELPALGGNSRLRGYYQGRYRDHLYVMGQLEWRVRVVGRFSLAPFAGVGNVFPSPSAMSFERTKVAGGLAVRFNLKKERELNVHLDVAVSPTSSGVYFNMGEAF